jgi:hypothetical protein
MDGGSLPEWGQTTTDEIKQKHPNHEGKKCVKEKDTHKYKQTQECGNAHDADTILPVIG